MTRRRFSRDDVFRGPLLVVNAAHPLREGARPNLAPVSAAHPGILLEARAARLLACCIEAAGGRREIVPVSGWRSRREQQAIWDDTLRESGEAFTRQYVAVPGCSEHQTGLAIDLGRAAGDIDFIRPDFPYDGACGAFRRAAARHGFIERYQAGKEALTGIAAEPWHFRFVGAPHAALIEENDLCLEEYPAFLRENGPLSCRLRGGRAARVSYVPIPEDGAALALPDGCVQVSGDNLDGLIVTVWEAGA